MSQFTLIWSLVLCSFAVHGNNGSSDNDSTNSVISVPSKRRKMEKINSIAFYVNVDDTNEMEEMHERAQNGKDMVISSKNDGSHHSATDIAVQSAMMVIDHFVSPEFQGITEGISGLLFQDEFEGFLKVASCFSQNQELHGTVIANAFTDLYDLYSAKCRHKGRLDVECLLEYTSQVEILRRHLSVANHEDNFQVMHQQMAEKDTSGGIVPMWTLLGFWKSYLQRALLQQFEDCMTKHKSQMNQEERVELMNGYLGERGMRQMLLTIWDWLQIEGTTSCNDPLLLPMKLLCEKMQETYVTLQQLSAEANIHKMVATCMNGKHCGSIGVVVMRPPSEGLISRLKDMGFDEEDQIKVFNIFMGKEKAWL